MTRAAVTARALVLRALLRAVLIFLPFAAYMIGLWFGTGVNLTSL